MNSRPPFSNWFKMAAHIPPEVPVGCSHYKRRSKILAPCCNKVYYCRFCHDENEDHKLNRRDIVELYCTVCGTKQKVRKKCINCNVKFARYACMVCKFFDDEDKKQFHCDGCGLCRVGGRENFFHCGTCNFCLPLSMQNNHKCIPDTSRQNCPICLDDIHSSRIPARLLSCGHLLHTDCWDKTVTAGHSTCPVCRLNM